MWKKIVKCAFTICVIFLSTMLLSACITINPPAPAPTIQVPPPVVTPTPTPSKPTPQPPVDRQFVIGIQGTQDEICYANAGKNIAGYILPPVEGIEFVIHNPQGGVIYNEPWATSRVDFSVYCDTDGYYRMWFKNNSVWKTKTVWLHYEIR